MERIHELNEWGKQRRKLIAGGLVLGAATLATKFGLDLDGVPSNSSSRATTFSGMIPNCHRLPFLDDPVQSRLIKNIDLSNSSATRVFLDDSFEPTLGDYRYEYIEKVIQLSQRTPLTVDLFDAYYFLHADKTNPGFPSSRLSSPYLVPKDDRSIDRQQRAIFTDLEIRSAYMERIKAAAKSLINVAGVIGIGLANELNIRMRNFEQARLVHTSFYKEAVDNLIGIGWNKTIFIGVDDPNLIDEEEFRDYSHQVVNTYHAYPWQPHLNMIRAYRRQESHILPLVCQEVGLPRRTIQPDGSILDSSDYDEEYSRFLIATLARLSEYDEESRTFMPLISGFGPWRISAEGDPHEDGYEIEPNKMQKTANAFKYVLSAIRLPASSAA